MRSRLLAGLRHRLGSHLVVTAAVAVVTYAASLLARDGADRAAAAPLLLLALGVVPVAGATLGSGRRQEAALLRLRGTRRLSFLRALALEPLVPVLAGGAIGIAVDRPDEPRAWTVQVAVVAACGLLVVGGMLVALREPLTAQLGGRARTAGTATVTRYLAVLVLVAALVAVLRRDSTSPGWWPYVGATLVGLAAGVAVAGLLRLVASWLRTRPEVAPVLVGRRLQTPRAAAGLALLVGAGALLGLATNTALAVREWEADTRVVTAGAPLVLEFEGDPDEVLRATREVDPDGRWLMAAVLVLDDSRPMARRAYVDTARWDRVVGDLMQGTSAEAGAEAVSRLRDETAAAEPEPTTTGRRLDVTIGWSGGEGEDALVAVLTDGVDGQLAQQVFVRLPADGTTTASVPLSRCEEGCRVVGMEVAVGPPCDADEWARPACRRSPVQITRLDVGGLDLLQRDWAVDEPDERPPGTVTVVPGGLEVLPSTAGRTFLTVDRSPWSVPVLATDSVEWPEGPQAPTTGSLVRPARVLAQEPVLPLVGSAGVLLDLPSSSPRGGSATADARAAVLARSDTPPELLAGLGAAQTPEEATDDLIRDSGSGFAGRLLAVGGGSLALGLLALLLAAPQTRRERTREHAALRAVGVDRPALRSAAWTQAALTAAAAGVATALAAVAAITWFSAAVPALEPQPAQLPLDTGVRVVAVLVPSVVALLAVLLTGAWASGSLGRASRPATLREEDAR